jgi:hypothetical protein
MNPTHRVIATGDLVFAEGYDPADLEELPDGYFEAAELQTAKVDGRTKVDQTAGAFRATFLTDIPGQETIYTVKAAEAQKWLGTVAPTADRAVFPYLYAEAMACLGSATVQTMTARAQIIMAAASQVAAANPVIEAQRVARKEAITAATTPEEVQTLATVDWAGLLQDI